MNSTELEELTKARWRQALENAALKRETPIRADSFLRDWPSFSRPVALACNDGNDYVVKGRQVGRAVVNDQVIARLGLSIGAPVGHPKLIDIPIELIQIEPSLRHVSPGVAHGTLFEADCSDRAWIAHYDIPANRSRFASLSVLYGWAHAGDHQLIYSNNPPHLVYSVDHGHFFPSGPDWIASSLLQNLSAQLEPTLVQGCSLTSDELEQALQGLASVAEDKIIDAVAIPPDEWGVTMDERLAMVEFFVKRRDDLLNAPKNAMP